MRTTERAQEGRGVGWLCEWRGVNRVADMKARGVRFEVVQRAVMGGYLRWEDSTGSGGGESEAAETAAQVGEESQDEGTLAVRAADGGGRSGTRQGWGPCESVHREKRGGGTSREGGGRAAVRKPAPRDATSGGTVRRL